MMGNFSDFIKEGSKIDSNKESNKKTYSEEELTQMINKYSAYGKDELMKEFLKLTLEKKRRNELTPEMISNLKSTLYPMLTEEQKLNLNTILEMVENVE